MKPDRSDTSMEGWRERFLAKLAVRGNVAESARAAGVNRQHVYDVKGREPDFAAAWDEAIEVAVDGLEAVAWARAKKQSDSLLTMLLKVHRAEKYDRPAKLNLGGDADNPIRLEYVNDWRRRPEPNDPSAVPALGATNGKAGSQAP